MSVCVCVCVSVECRYMHVHVCVCVCGGGGVFGCERAHLSVSLRLSTKMTLYTTVSY